LELQQWSFLTYLELAQATEQAETRAEQAEARAEQAEAQLQALQNLLRERGIDPEQL
jgi:DNA-binding protein H-NS